MAIKDWKIYLRSKDDIIYTEKNTLTKLFIIREIDQYNVSVPGIIMDRNHVFKVFKTKSEALKFAKQYMRTH